MSVSQYAYTTTGKCQVFLPTIAASQLPPLIVAVLETVYLSWQPPAALHHTNDGQQPPAELLLVYVQLLEHFRCYCSDQLPVLNRAACHIVPTQCTYLPGLAQLPVQYV